MNSKVPRRWEAAHLAFALTMVGAAAISLFVGGEWLALAVAVLINVFLISVLCELAMRRQSKSATSHWLIEIPFVILSLPIMALLTVAIVTAFARMYIASEGVSYIVDDFQIEMGQRLTDEWDAIYFSGVTFATLGYGDFVPVTRTARLLVLWQLATTVLFLLGILPLLITRLADFDKRLPG